MLVQVAQVGHTQPINTRQSNPGDTPRAQHHWLDPDQSSGIRYGSPDQVDSLWEASPGGTHYADDKQGLPKLRRSEVGDATNPFPVPACPPREGWLTTLPSLLSPSVSSHPALSTLFQHKIYQKQFDFLYLQMTFGRKPNRIATWKKTKVIPILDPCA